MPTAPKNSPTETILSLKIGRKALIARRNKNEVKAMWFTVYLGAFEIDLFNPAVKGSGPHATMRSWPNKFFSGSCVKTGSPK